MIKMQKLLLIVSLTFFTGCAQLVPYEPPSKGPISKLILPAKSTSYSFGFNGATTWFAISDESGCGEFYKPKKALDEHKSTEYIIPANKDVFINFGAYVGNATCHIARVINNVEEDKVYVVNVSVKDNYCTLAVTKKSKNEEIPIKMNMAYVESGFGHKICKHKGQN